MSTIEISPEGIKVDGINRTAQRMRRWAKQDKQALRGGMAKAARYLLKRAREEVPEKTGHLKRSGKFKVLNNSEKIPQMSVSFDTDYAVYVHEDMEAFHPVGNAKFLERPAREYRLTLIHIIETHMREATRMRRSAGRMRGGR